MRIETLVETVAQEVLGTTTVSFRGHELDLKAPWARIRFTDALEEHGLWTRDEAELRALLTSAGVDTEADRDWTQLVDHAFSHFVEPELIQPTIVHDYPIELSPFARATDDDPTLTERFEYFAGGMELGNAFSEINDAATQQERFEHAVRSRSRASAATRTTSRRSRTGCRPPAGSASGSTAS